MAGFENVLPALMNGKGIRRDEWGCDSRMYANYDGQLMRTPTQYPKVCDEVSHSSNGHDYGWVLSLDDLAAKDWQVITPLSRFEWNRQFPNPSATHGELARFDSKLILSKPQRVLRYAKCLARVFHQFFRRNWPVLE
jgi:hypothetical protein